jgi:hypothetical protein
MSVLTPKEFEDREVGLLLSELKFVHETTRELRVKRAELIRRLKFEHYLTIREIGDYLGVSRERVRQIAGNTGGKAVRPKKRKIASELLVGEERENFYREHFWDRVDVRGQDECWLWKGSTLYCRLPSNDQITIYKAAWYYSYKDVPRTPLWHSCKTKKCCNPAHLYLPGDRNKTPKEREIKSPEYYRIKFFSKVDVRGEDECWPWKGGYPVFYIYGRCVTIRYALWFAIHGEFPPGKTRSSCRNAVCCNPRHIVLSKKASSRMIMARALNSLQDTGEQSPDIPGGER